MWIENATVEKLIEALQKIEDKSKKVLIWDQWGEEWTDEIEIDEDKNSISLV